MLRLLKLLRIARLNRIFRRYEARLHAILTQLKMAKMILVIMTIGHLMGCFWFLCGTWQSTAENADGSKRTGWVEKQFGAGVRSDWVTECETV
eukprot:SAG31_NODE_4843_length_2910_cov_2.040911_3_plen_93_part_00